MLLAVRGTTQNEVVESAQQRLLDAVMRGRQSGVEEAVKTIDAIGARGAAYLRDPEGDYLNMDAFAVDIAPNAQAFALSYVTLVEALYPGATWRTEHHGPAQAVDIEGRVVAVVQPLGLKAR